MEENTGEVPIEKVDQIKSNQNNAITEETSQKLTKRELPPLPFTYQRTDDPKKAEYKVARKKLVVLNGESPFNTDDEILKEIKEDRERRDWFLDNSWREKEQPEEQIEFDLNGERITLYNFCKEKQITDQQVLTIQKALEEFSSRFPQVLENIKYILINDKPNPSAWGDEKKFPYNGTLTHDRKGVLLFPRTLEELSHRIGGATILDGTIIHEITHTLTSYFRDDWEANGFKEVRTVDNEDWEQVKSPDGQKIWYQNKKTGRIVPSHHCMIDPNQCVTEYASINQSEDISESMVAYLFNPELLKVVSPKKFEILQNNDAKQTVPQVTTKRIPKDEIKLPEIKPEVIYYYVDEPAV